MLSSSSSFAVVVAAIVFVVIGAATMISPAAGQIAFRACSQTAGVVSKVVVEGSDNKRVPNIKRGVSYTIAVDYTAPADASTLTSHWFAVIAGQKLPWIGQKTAPGCSVTSGGCPIRKGKQYTYRETFTVPSDAPLMRTLARIEQVGNNGVENLCLLLPLNLKA